ncbi:MAG: TonB-dependent receptor domain-containing protein, partial [Chitinophagaceae bacterium]
ASSALYGSGGTNGTLIMTSKNPFKYQGFSFIIKQGANHIDNAQRSTAPVYDWSFRWAKKLSEKFAFKISGQLTQVQDWQATDRSNLLRNNVLSTPKAGDRMSDPNYDGVNVFGDEASASMLALAQAVRFQVGATPQGAGAIGAIDNLLNAGTNPGLVFNNPAFAALRPFMPFIIGSNRTVNYFGSQLVSRTGYDERDLVDYNAYNVKLNGGLYYKITDNVEASLVAYYGMGTTVYTGSDRYSIKNLRLGQYKLEIKGKNWFVRGYTTQENSGDAYTATTAALAVNNAWKSNTTWFQQYVGTYAGARLQGLADGQAHGAARAAADQGRFLPGTEQFKNAFNAAVNTSIGTPGKDGAKFADNTSLYHYEGQYNLTEALKFAEVLVGASYRTFRLNSNGTIFADTTGPININEVGGYLQMSKKLFNDAVKLTGSVRYDKNQNFEGRFTPRLSATFKVAQDNNFRVSYQTGYRFPSTQDQYINLATPGSRLIGGMPSFNTFFNFNNSPGYTAESVAAFRAAVGSNLTPAGIGAAVPLLRQVQFSPLRPEQVKSFEIGYRGLITKSLLIDGYFYTSRYSDFI